MIKKLSRSILLALAIMFSQLTAVAQHIITMQEADIRAFIDDVSMVTGKTFLVDPRVVGKVTISSEQSLNPGEVFNVFKNVLRVHGYVVTRTSANTYRISLIQGAAQDAPFVSNSGLAGQFATTVIKTSHTDAAEAAKLIKPVLHQQGILTANPGGNILVVSDFPENLRKARAIIGAMDTNERVMETVSLSNMSAVDARDALATLAGPRPKYKLIAIPATNSLILEGEPGDIEPLKTALFQMDQAGVSSGGAVSVVPLRFADGSTIIELLTTLLPAYNREGQPLASAAYEPGSNTIVISGSSEAQLAMESVIRRLDQRRPQVLVEAIIVEISDTAAKELGVQFAISPIGNNGVPFIGTNYTGQASSALALAGVLAGDRLGVSDATQSALETAALNSVLGTNGAVLGGAGVSGTTVFSAIVNALETDEDSNILSTPFVTTIDNVPATFLVGQEIPITTGESLGSNNVNPFRTFERKEVGIRLEVLPQISQGDVIRLEISQEVSSIAGAISSISSDFITNKREITTTVLAEDGEVIVLGGLIQDDEQISIDKVPVLGDAPVVGPLFRNKDKSRVKTNLMVFLRPTIIRDSSDARPLTDRRLDYMRVKDVTQSGRTGAKVDEYLDDVTPVE